MNRSEILHTWETAEALAAEAIRVGIPAEKVNDILATVASLCIRLFDELDRVGAR